MISRAGQWTQTPSTTPLQSKKNEMLIFGLHSTSDDWLGWLMDLNPCYPYNIRKVGFCLSCNFCNLFPLKWLGMANFIQFATFPIFSHRRGSEWLRTANFAWFTTFPSFSHQSGSEWLGTANFAWFATFPIFCHQSGSDNETVYTAPSPM